MYGEESALFFTYIHDKIYFYEFECKSLSIAQNSASIQLKGLFNAKVIFAAVIVLGKHWYNVLQSMQTLQVFFVLVFLKKKTKPIRSGQMKVKSTKSKIIATISVVAITIVIAIIANLFQIAADDAVLNSTRNEMIQIVEQLELTIENEIKTEREELSQLSEYMSKNNINAENAAELLSSQSQTEEYSNVYFVDLEGNGVSAENKMVDFSENEAFLYVLEHEKPSEVTRVSELEGAKVLDIAVPIIQNERVVAVLIGEAFAGDFFNVLNSVITEGWSAFIVNKSLGEVFSITGEDASPIFVSEEDVAEMGQDNAQKLQYDIENGLSGSFFYGENDADNLMVYSSIESTEWTLIVDVETVAINAGLDTAVDHLKLTTQIIYWGLICLILYIGLTQARSLKLLSKSAYFDPLTKMPNMAKLKIDMKEVLTHNRDSLYTVIVYDIENFKAINEMFGHDVGDKLLKAMKTFAESYNEPSLIAARIGGDKFAMFSGRHFLGDIDVLINKVSDHFDAEVPEMIDYAGTFKIGRYNIEKGECDVDDIVEKVSLAHARAKEIKGEFLCDYDDLFRKKLQKEAEISNKMKLALENHEFKVYLQPKFSVYDHKLVGAEALVRWQEASGAMIYPNDFVPLFERNGFITELDQYVLKIVCSTIQRWQGEGRGCLCISVNSSRLNLENPFFVQDIATIADQYHVPHEYIEIELTESITIQGDDEIEKLFADLRDNGFKTSIDDFGSGYSSLGMLKNLNVDTLKIDRSFFVGNKIARRDDMLIDSIVKLSHNLGMYVVAEGIESQEQIEFLKTMNCDAVQGYVHAKPMPISEFEEKYKDVMIDDCMSKEEEIPLIYSINDAKFANSIVPCGIIISEMDKYFTMVEANEGYFDIVGYTNEEIRKLYKNRGLDMLHPEDKNGLTRYYASKIAVEPEKSHDYVCRLAAKNEGYKTVQLNGKLSTNENGQARLYFSVMDISAYRQATDELKKEKEFNTLISFLTENMFFDYDEKTDTMRFSKNFAQRANIPEEVKKFHASKVKKEVFPKDFFDFIDDALQQKQEGELQIKLPDGKTATYLCKYTYFTDRNKKRFRTVGKLSEIESQVQGDVFHNMAEGALFASGQQSTDNEQLIQEVLANMDACTPCALFKIHLGNFIEIQNSFGSAYANTIIEEIGGLLGGMFRSVDIIGKIGSDEFFVFIKSHKSTDIVERKAVEICKALEKVYEKDDACIRLIPKVGIALYPQHGLNFKTLYNRANKALLQVKNEDNIKYTIYEEDE